MNAEVAEQLRKSRELAAATLALSASVAREFSERRALAHIAEALQQFASMRIVESATTSALRSAEAAVANSGSVASLGHNADCIEYLHSLAVIISGEFDRAIRLAETKER
jgi:hypothetical protein